MAKILIGDKEHTYSDAVKQEIEWQNIKLKNAIMLAKMIKEKQEEIDEFTRKKQSEIQDLIDQLNNLD